MNRLFMLVFIFITFPSFALVLKDGDSWQQSDSERYSRLSITTEPGSTILKRPNGFTSNFYTGRFEFNGGDIYGGISLRSPNSVSFSGANFDDKVTISYPKESIIVNGGTFTEFFVSSIYDGMTISSGEFSEQAQLVNIASTVTIEGGLFNKSIRLSPSLSTGVASHLRLMGTNWRLNNEPITLINGVIDISNRLANGAQNPDYAILQGTLADGNDAEIWIDYAEASSIVTLHESANILGVISGISPITVECSNMTTGQVISFNTNEGDKFDCKVNGLNTSSGDEVELKITGQSK